MLIAKRNSLKKPARIYLRLLPCALFNVMSCNSRAEQGEFSRIIRALLLAVTEMLLSAEHQGPVSLLVMKLTADLSRSSCSTPHASTHTGQTAHFPLSKRRLGSGSRPRVQAVVFCIRVRDAKLSVQFAASTANTNLYMRARP